jgi:hypothetical protein
VEALSHGRKIELNTYRSDLKHLFKKPTLNTRQTGWLESLSEYNFDIKHIKGKENKVVDELSMRAHEIHAIAIRMYCLDIKRISLEVVESYQHYAYITEGLQQENVLLKFKYYRLEEDVNLFFRDKFYVPNTWELRNIVLKEMRNVPYDGHPRY